MVVAVTVTTIAGAQAPASPSAASAGQAPPETLLSQAVKAERDLRFDLATDRLYELIIEHPDTHDAVLARLRLARLLALAGHLEPAILECQAVRNESAGDAALGNQALELATTLVRRLRATSPAGYFRTFEAVAARGVQSIDEPRTVVFESDGRFLMLDQGAARLYRVGLEAATQLPVPQEPSAVTVLPNGTVAIAGKTGVATGPVPRVVAFSGNWGGKARQAKKVRSMAALSTGDVLVIDRDYDGALRCQLDTGTCAPWGPVGKYRTVKVGASDWVYLLDDRGQTVRVLDPSARPITVVGPIAGTARFEKVEDIAVDLAHGLYLLDTKLKRVHIITLRAAPDGTVSAMATGSADVPQEGDRTVKNPTAIGVAPGGSLVIAGRSPRIMRFR